MASQVNSTNQKFREELTQSVKNLPAIQETLV